MLGRRKRLMSSECVFCSVCDRVSLRRAKKYRAVKRNAVAAAPIVVVIAAKFHWKRVLMMKQYGTFRKPMRHAKMQGINTCSALKAQLRLKKLESAARENPSARRPMPKPPRIVLDIRNCGSESNIEGITRKLLSQPTSGN